MAKTHLAVLGSPIEHSKSPVIHAAAYEALGLDWDYGRYRIEANELEDFLRLRDDTWRGLSLTMPLKEIGYTLSTPSCPVASATGIVNTLLHTESGWEGYNTDAFGLRQAVTRHSKHPFTKIAVLGSGATANSAIYAMKDLFPNSEVFMFARKSVSIHGVKAQPLETFYELEDADLVISTLPGSVQHPVPLVSSKSVILDVAYSPWPSKLAQHWPEGNRISGIEMLLWQALVQVRIFTLGTGSEKLPNEDGIFAAMRAAVKA